MAYTLPVPAGGTRLAFLAVMVSGAIALAGGSALAATDVVELTRKFTDSNADDLDRVGLAVDAFGTVGIVSSHGDDDIAENSGAAYIVDGRTGDELLKLKASDARAGDRFGKDVGIHGDFAIVGADLENNKWGQDAGAAYIFNATNGHQRAKLIAPDGAAGDQFGHAVAIRGKYAVIGAFGKNDDTGAAYVFDIGERRMLRKLVPSDLDVGDRFGFSVAIHGNLAVIGAYGDDDDHDVILDPTTGVRGDSAGAAYVFNMLTGQQIAKLTPNDRTAKQDFGISVDIYGDVVVVGAQLDDEGGTDAGAAYVFSASTGTQIAKLRASDGQAKDLFGRAVSINSEAILVGAYGADPRGGASGGAYLFKRANLTEYARLVAGDGQSGDLLGFSGALSEDILILGAYGSEEARRGDPTALERLNAGAAYVQGIPPVPLPSTAWMMIGAFGGLGAMRRWRKSRTA